jgi:DNA polymerase III gamma/tau subunit
MITAAYVSKTAGHFDSEKIIKICGCIKDNDAENALIIFWEMYEASLDCGNFCGSLLEAFRNIQVAKIMREPNKYISADEREIAEIIEVARDFDSADLIRCYELVSKVFSGLNRYTANKRVAVEMLLCEMCLTKSAGVSANAGAIINRPQKSQAGANNTGGKKSFAALADMVEEIAKENKIVSQYLKGAACGIDGGRFIIRVDSEFKANILSENTAVIKKYADSFAGGDFAVAVELLNKPDDRGSANSIDDIEV